MERVVSVNGAVESRRAQAASGFEPHPTGEFDWGEPEENGGEILEDASVVALPRSSVAASAGTCLYFGPRGERCSRPALTNGFCTRHQPGVAQEAPSSAKRKRMLGAIIGILGVLWPLLSELFHELFRWMHSH